MPRAAIVILADTESHADLGRVFNAMIAAKEFKQAGDEVRLIFDGAGTKWPSVLSGSDHPAHQLYQQVADVISGACGFCAKAFEAEQHVHDAGVGVIEEYEGHPSLRNLLVEGYSVLTF